MVMARNSRTSIPLRRRWRRSIRFRRDLRALVVYVLVIAAILLVMFLLDRGLILGLICPP